MDSTKKAQSGQLIKVKKVESNVRYGSFCDIAAALAEVRFVPYSGRIGRRWLVPGSVRCALGAQIDAACLRRSAPGGDLAGVDPTPLRSRGVDRLHPTFFAP
jgi:hypothetical protein